MNTTLTFKALRILVVVAMLSGAALAEDDAAKDIKKMDGKELYKNICKACHAEDSEAGEYTPMSLIMDQWDEFYDETFAETHQDVTCPKDEKTKLVDKLDKDMIKKLRKFCVDHAADSEQPMTCG
jgi:cytochrome c553